MKLIIISALLLAITSCGGGGGGGGSKGSPVATPRERADEVNAPNTLGIEFDRQAKYLAVLHAANPIIAPDVAGNVNLTRHEDELIGYVRFAGGAPEIGHQQRVYEGSECPTMAQDTNGDGILDVEEVMVHVGKVLIPLDGDLSTQDRGSSVTPVADIYGGYWWEDVVNFERFAADLRDTDFDLEDDVVKLGAEKMLDIEGKVVLIHGVQADAALPASVATRGRLANHQTLPVACGILRKINTVPGTYEDDPSIEIDPNEVGPTDINDGATVPLPQEETTEWRWPWERRPETTPAPAPQPTPIPEPIPETGDYGTDDVIE